MAKQKKPLTDHQLLAKELKELATCYNTAKSRWSFNKEWRTYGKMAEMFGVVVKDTALAARPVTKEEVDIFHKQLITILKDKYANKWAISERACQVSEAIQEGASSPRADHTTDEGQGNLLSIEDGTSNNQDGEPSQETFSDFSPKYPDQKADLGTQKSIGCNQVLAAKTLYDKLTRDGNRAMLLLATTGAGKTYILSSVAKNFIQNGWLKKLSCISPWPMLYVTKASIVEQTKTVLEEEFGIDAVNTIHVINIEQLRSSLGSMFVKEYTKVVNGEAKIAHKWNPHVHPCVIFWDECQILARADDSIQGEIALAASEIESNYGKRVVQIFSSATPFTRVSEAKVFVLAIRPMFHLGMGEVPVTEDNWPLFARSIASPSEPTDYCTAAVKRLMDFLEPWIYRVQGIRPKFKATNRVSKIYFSTKEEKEEYDKAWDKYQEEKAKIEGGSDLSDSQSRFALLAQFTIFRKAAERIRRYHLAKFADESWQRGLAPAIACAFKGTITSTYRILIEDYNWSEMTLVLSGEVAQKPSARKRN
jgi:hypothetical protein